MFTVTRSSNDPGTTTVKYATQYGNSDTSVQDLDAQSGTITFAPFQTSQTITIFVKGDSNVEQNDLFFVSLSAPTRATLADLEGRGDILNDD